MNTNACHSLVAKSAGQHHKCHLSWGAAYMEATRQRRPMLKANNVRHVATSCLFLGPLTL